MELQKLIDGLKAHKYGAASYESVDEAIRVFEAMRDVDREKVCKGLEICTESTEYGGCITCPYHEDHYYPNLCRYANAKDALALIRQQQERIKELEYYEKRFAEWAKRNNAHVCATCGRASHNRPNTTACPIEEHYAVPLDGGCHLWEET